MRVHDAGNGAIVDVAEALGNVFNAGDGFFFGFVCEHGTKRTVADDSNVWDFGAVFPVDYKPPTLIELETDVFDAQTRSVRSSANRNKADLSLEGLSFTAFGSFHVEFDS